MIMHLIFKSRNKSESGEPPGIGHPPSPTPNALYFTWVVASNLRNYPLPDGTHTTGGETRGSRRIVVVYICMPRLIEVLFRR